ncbi:MAG: FtsX-like permease family protein [Verrucomicrobiales bacterium]
MNFPLFLALRYLKPKRSVVSVITLFCVLGVMLGVGALIVVISVMNGFQKKIREELLRVDPHVVAIPPPSDPSIPAEARVDWRAVAQELQKQTEVVLSLWAVIEAPATIEVEDAQGGKRLDPVLLYAVDETSTDMGSKLNLVEGSFDLVEGSEGVPAVIPEAIALKWGFHVGSTITLQSFRNAEEAYKMIDKWEKTPREERGDADKWFEEMKQVVQPAELIVKGIFQSRQHTTLIITPLHIGKEMLVKGDEIDYLAMTTPDPLQVGRYRDAIESVLPDGWMTETWRERHQQYFDAVESERGMMYVLLLLIMIVAAFCIIVTLATVAIHKRKEIGVVRSLGARLGQIVAIFVGQGTIVGFAGTLLGLGGGLLFLAKRMAIKSAVQWVFGVEIINPQVYGVSEIPCDVRPYDVTLICAISLAVSTLAGVLPALIAAWQEPAKALRSE